jgi:biopolymer transport protein ExbD
MELRRVFILLVMKRPKLFYIPGMLSLLVVPVLFYFYQPVIKTSTVLKLYLPKDVDSKSPYIYSYSSGSIKAALKRKKINTVYLDGDHSLNAKKLDFIAQDALKLKFYNDTTQIIKVRFTDEATYGEFVQLVNIMYRDGHKRFGWMDNDFYIFGNPPPEPHVVLYDL